MPSARRAAGTASITASRQQRYRASLTGARLLASAAVPAVNSTEAGSTAPAVQKAVVMLGAGNMGGAMMKGWLTSGVAAVENLAACVRAEENVIAWDKLGVQARSVYSPHEPRTHLRRVIDV